MSAPVPDSRTPGTDPSVGRRPVGRPRQYDDEAERRLILDSAYASLRDRGPDFTIANILSAAGISTRSFYRHFGSKDELLHAMYLRDARWAADRLAKRLAEAGSPRQSIEWWIDEIFSFVRLARRAERVAVLSSISIAPAGGPGADTTAIDGRSMLVGSLVEAIRAGQDAGYFAAGDPATLADLVAATTMHAVGLPAVARSAASLDQATTTAFCLRALGTEP